MAELEESPQPDRWEQEGVSTLGNGLGAMLDSIQEDPDTSNTFRKIITDARAFVAVPGRMYNAEKPLPDVAAAVAIREQYDAQGKKREVFLAAVEIAQLERKLRREDEHVRKLLDTD